MISLHGRPQSPTRGGPKLSSVPAGYFREDRRTVLFCAGGGRSALAADALREMGFQNVAHLEPGFGGWQKAGEPAEDVRGTSRWVRRTEGRPAAGREPAPKP